MFLCGALFFAAPVNIGGAQITEAVMKHLKIPAEEVNHFKNESGMLPQEKENKELSTALRQMVTALKDEVAKHLRYWEDRVDPEGNPAPRIEKLLLCGGSSNLAGLDEYLSGTLRLPVELGNVFANAFSFDDVIPDIDRRASLGYAATIGLALRTLD